VVLNDVWERLLQLGESAADSEQVYIDLRLLYLEVLTAIARGECQGASPQAFAAEALRGEQILAELHGAP
jgi:hypothetical protein